MKIGILGYGNLGRGVECAIKQNPDMELVAVFTRRDPSTVKIQTNGVKVCHVDEASSMTAFSLPVKNHHWVLSCQTLFVLIAMPH